MLKLDLYVLLIHTPIVLQLADKSIINHEGVLEKVRVYIDSWEYPTYFIVI